MRLSIDDWAMELVGTIAKRSTCCRRSVGCLLLNDKNHVIATGYNGVAAGMLHCNEPVSNFDKVYRGEDEVMIREIFPNSCIAAFEKSGTHLDGCEAIHAEQNALLQCRNTHEIHSCYVSTSPCITCVKLLMNTSCERIVFAEPYPHNEARDLWLKVNRKWIHHNSIKVNL